MCVLYSSVEESYERLEIVKYLHKSYMYKNVKEREISVLI